MPHCTSAHLDAHRAFVFVAACAKLNFTTSFKEIIVSGCSAGGMACYLHCDYVAEYFAALNIPVRASLSTPFEHMGCSYCCCRGWRMTLHLHWQSKQIIDNEDTDIVFCCCCCLLLLLCRGIQTKCVCDAGMFLDVDTITGAGNVMEERYFDIADEMSCKVRDTLSRMRI